MEPGNLIQLKNEEYDWPEIENGRVIQTSEPILRNVTSFACGDSHIVAINARGDIFSWGEGRCGQLGHGDKRFQETPKQIEALKDHFIVQVACGPTFSVCITDVGNLFLWGNRVDCLVSQKFVDRYLKPTEIIIGEKLKILQISCGTFHIAALCTNEKDNIEFGDVYVWGYYQKLNDKIKEETNFSVPTFVEFLKGKKIVQIACHYQETVTLTKNGEIYYFGGGVIPLKEISLGYTVRQLDCSFATNQQIKKITCCDFSIVILTNEGVYETCDRKYFTKNSSLIRTEKILESNNLRTISSFKRVIFALTEIGEIFCIPAIDPNSDYKTKPPVPVLGFQNEVVTSLCCGGDYTVILTSSSFLISQDLLYAINQSNFSDITFLVSEGAKFFAHKLICSRFPEIEKLIKDKDEVFLENMSKQSCYCLLRYIYTDFLENASVSVLKEVSNFASHYQLFHLQFLCNKALNLLEDKSNPPKSHYLQYFEKIINNKYLSDISFTIQDQVFYCHKIILASRVPFFKNMFTGKFKEASEKNVKLDLKDDISASYFSSLMKFVYTGKVDLTGETVVPILELASMYQLERLKTFCEDEIILGIDEENVFSLFQLAETYQCPTLLSACLDFLAQHHELTSNPQFQQLSTQTKKEIQKREKMFQQRTFADQIKTLLNKFNQQNVEVGCLFKLKFSEVFIIQ